jgi:hypothetical protein
MGRRILRSGLFSTLQASSFVREVLIKHKTFIITSM